VPAGDEDVDAIADENRASFYVGRMMQAAWCRYLFEDIIVAGHLHFLGLL
jgi:hypothetical protein